MKDLLLAACASSGGGIEVEGSGEFDGSSSYLSRTPSAAGNTGVFTISVWVKQWASSDHQPIYWADDTGLYITRDGEVSFRDNGTTRFRTAATYGFGVWMHIVVACDVGVSGSDKLRLWVDGVEITSLSVDGRTGVTGVDLNGSTEHRIGLGVSSITTYSSVYLAELAVVDGAALDASAFGEDQDGVWGPIAPKVSAWGVNGVYLPGGDVAAGTDASGGGNDFTPTNVVDAADSPTNAYPIFDSGTTDMQIQRGGRYVYFNPKTATRAYSQSEEGMFPGGVAASHTPLTAGRWYVETLVDYRDQRRRLWGGVHSWSGRSWAGTGFIRAAEATTDNNIGYALRYGPSQSASTPNDAIGVYWHDGVMGGPDAMLGITRPGGGTVYELDHPLLRAVHLLDLDLGQYWVGIAEPTDTAPLWFPGDPDTTPGLDVSTAAGWADGVVFAHAPNWPYRDANTSHCAHTYAEVAFSESDWAFAAPTGAKAITEANIAGS